MAQQEIVRGMGHALGESTIRQYLAGATPLHWRGELLLRLWEERTGRDRVDAPRRPAEMRRVSVRRSPKVGGHMPTEHLSAVARAYGISVTTLVDLLGKRRKAVRRAEPESLPLPGFEE
ncbi:MAG: hypothetical protein AB7E55_03265 [Pigmentiphaga sp.]